MNGKILIVEDDEELQELYAAMLEGVNTFSPGFTSACRTNVWVEGLRTEPSARFFLKCSRKSIPNMGRYI